MYVVYRETDNRIVGIFHEWDNANCCLKENEDTDYYEIQTDMLDNDTVHDMISGE